MSRRTAHENSHKMVNRLDSHYLDKVISGDKLLKNRKAGALFFSLPLELKPIVFLSGSV